VHAIAHPVGSWFNTHHGLTNAVVLPYVMTFNRAAIADKADVIARVLDLPVRGFEGLLGWVLELRRELGIPHSLAEIGVSTGKADIIGREAAIDPIRRRQPDHARCNHPRTYLSRRSRRETRGRGQRRVSGARILVIDGNVAEIRARQAAALGYDSGKGYARVLRRIDPRYEWTSCSPPTQEPAFPRASASATTTASP
jgi:hypothetical protein